jgi:hypothetical protein
LEQNDAHAFFSGGAGSHDSSLSFGRGENTIAAFLWSKPVCGSRLQAGASAPALCKLKAKEKNEVKTHYKLKEPV